VVGFVDPRAKVSVRTVNSDLHFGHAMTVLAGAETGSAFLINSDAPPLVMTSACADETSSHATARLDAITMLRSVFIYSSFSFAFKPLKALSTCTVPRLPPQRSPCLVQEFAFVGHWFIAVGAKEGVTSAKYVEAA
jgi:hypothetical protein